MHDHMDRGLLVISLPIQMRRVAGRKLMILADMTSSGDRSGTPRPRAAERGEMGKGSSRPTGHSQNSPLRDQAVRTALAVRWVRLLEDGTFDSMAGLGRAVSVDPSAMARMVRRADGKRPTDLTF